MTEKYRNAVNKPINLMRRGRKNISNMNPDTKAKKFLKGSALVGMGLAEFMMRFVKLVALDNKILRRLEKKLADINVGKDKNGYEKKFQAFIKKNPNLSAVAIWWAMLGMLIGGVNVANIKKSDKDADGVRKEIKDKRAGADKTVDLKIAQKEADINKKLDKKYKMTSRAEIKRIVLENFAYTQATLFSTENYRTDWFCDNKTGVKNTLGVGLYYLPDVNHPYDFTCAKAAKASLMYNQYPRQKGKKVPRGLTDDEVYEGIRWWFFTMDNGYNFNQMCVELENTGIELTPRDLNVIASVLFNSPACCKKLCRYMVDHPNNRESWAKYLLRVDDDVDKTRLKNFSGLKGRRVHEILMLLDIDNYGQDMFGVQIDCKRASAVSYSNRYFDKLRKDFSKVNLYEAKSVICNGVVENGVSVCQVIQRSSKYKDVVCGYCADIDRFLFVGERQKVYNQALAAYKSKDYETALRGFNKVIELEGVSPDLFNDLAITYIHYQDYDKSIEMSQKALEIGSDEDLSASYFNLGLAYEKKGDIKSAKKYYQRAVEYGNGVAKSKLDRLSIGTACGFNNASRKVKRKQSSKKFLRGLFGTREQ